MTLTDEDRKLWITYILEQRRHYLGIAAACDRMLEALKKPGLGSVDAIAETCYDKDTIERVTPR